MIKLNCEKCRGGSTRLGAYDHEYVCPDCDGHGHTWIDEEEHFLNRLDIFVEKVKSEVIRARKLFPGRRIMGLALAEARSIWPTCEIW